MADEIRRVRTQAERDADGTTWRATVPEVRKIGYPMQVRMVDGVPQCPCCQEPMVKRSEGWMCAIGSATLDLLASAVARLDESIEETA